MFEICFTSAFNEVSLTQRNHIKTFGQYKNNLIFLLIFSGVKKYKVLLKLADYYESALKPNIITNYGIVNEVNELLNETCATAELPFRPTSPSEIKNIINKLLLKKSPRSDLISNSVLKNLTLKMIKTGINNECLYCCRPLPFIVETHRNYSHTQTRVG